MERQPVDPLIPHRGAYDVPPRPDRRHPLFVTIDVAALDKVRKEEADLLAAMAAAPDPRSDLMRHLFPRNIAPDRTSKGECAYSPRSEPTWHTPDLAVQWLGIDPSATPELCCVNALLRGLGTGGVRLRNPEAITDLLRRDDLERIRRSHLQQIRRTLSERADELIEHVVSGIEDVVAAGGEPGERLRAALQQALAPPVASVPELVTMGLGA